MGTGEEREIEKGEGRGGRCASARERWVEQSDYLEVYVKGSWRENPRHAAC